jgi:hypothetical protein
MEVPRDSKGRKEKVEGAGNFGLRIADCRFFATKPQSEIRNPQLSCGRPSHSECQTVPVAKNEDFGKGSSAVG